MPTTDINRTHLGNQIQWFKILPLETTVLSLAKPAESRSVLVIAGFVSAELPNLVFPPRLFHLLYTVKCQSCWNTDTKAIKTNTYWWLPVPKKCYDTWIPYLWLLLSLWLYHCYELYMTYSISFLFCLVLVSQGDFQPFLATIATLVAKVPAVAELPFECGRPTNVKPSCQWCGELTRWRPRLSWPWFRVYYILLI